MAAHATAMVRLRPTSGLAISSRRGLSDPGIFCWHVHIPERTGERAIDAAIVRKTLAVQCHYRMGFGVTNRRCNRGDADGLVQLIIREVRLVRRERLWQAAHGSHQYWCEVWRSVYHSCTGRRHLRNHTMHCGGFYQYTLYCDN